MRSFFRFSSRTGHGNPGSFFSVSVARSRDVGRKARGVWSPFAVSTNLCQVLPEAETAWAKSLSRVLAVCSLTASWREPVNPDELDILDSHGRGASEMADAVSLCCKTYIVCCIGTFIRQIWDMAQGFLRFFHLGSQVGPVAALAAAAAAAERMAQCDTKSQ